MLIKRNTIVYLPYVTKSGMGNEHEIKKIEILRRKYNVVGELAEPVDVYSMLGTKAVFLNWIEDELDSKMKLQLCLYKLFGAKIIWVFHNKFPHDAVEGDKHVAYNMRWLADVASHIMLHSKSSAKYIPNYRKNVSKKVYVPHLIYEKRLSQTRIEELRTKYDIGEGDFVFTMFGMIRPYKHYEDGVMAFKNLAAKGAKLILAGNCINVQYAKYLKELCNDNKDIILDLRYIPEVVLDAIIGISDVIVIPYVNKSSMNSGVMMQAFSNEKTVIIPDICMARDFAPQGFFYGYRRCLEKAMLNEYNNGKEKNRQMGHQAYEYVKDNNNDEIVSAKLYSMLGDL